MLTCRKTPLALLTGLKRTCSLDFLLRLACALRAPIPSLSKMRPQACKLALYLFLLLMMLTQTTATRPAEYLRLLPRLSEASQYKDRHLSLPLVEPMCCLHRRSMLEVPAPLFPLSHALPLNTLPLVTLPLDGLRQHAKMFFGRGFLWFLLRI
jgi:hypothetical protein